MAGESCVHLGAVLPHVREGVPSAVSIFGEDDTVKADPAAVVCQHKSRAHDGGDFCLALRSVGPNGPWRFLAIAGDSPVTAWNLPVVPAAFMSLQSVFHQLIPFQIFSEGCHRVNDSWNQKVRLRWGSVDACSCGPPVVAFEYSDIVMGSWMIARQLDQ